MLTENSELPNKIAAEFKLPVRTIHDTTKPLYTILTFSKKI